MNGTSWTSLTSLNTARSETNAAGVDNTSQLVFGGNIPPDTGATEYWNGSSWTELNDLATARRTGGQAGTTTSALLATGTNTSATEEFSYTATTQIVG